MWKFILIGLVFITNFSFAQPVTLVHDIATGTSQADPGWMTEFNNKLFFRAWGTAATSDELWEYDGTNTPTMSYDLNLGASSSYPEHFFEFNNKLYFTADNTGTNRELWVYDGTNPPSMVYEINPGTGNANIFDFEIFNNKLYFSATDGTHGNELWEYDGTNTPSMVMDINVGAGGGVSNLVAFNNKLYFSGNDGTNGAELWVYDGINPPSMLADIHPSSSSGPSNFLVFSNKLYFQANDGTNGYELWTYDGTNPPSIVQDINPGAVHAYPGNLTLFDNQLFFSANDGTNGIELWSYKGSGVATMVYNTNPGSSSFNPFELIVYNGKLYMTGLSAANGYELWEYDGIHPPSRKTDINPGAAHALPRYLAVFQDKLYFQATDPTYGIELWEFNTCNPELHVDHTATGNNDGTSWTDAYVSLESALTTARVNSCVTTIKVAQGTYKPSYAPGNNSQAKRKSFWLADGVAVFGGYPTGGGTRNWETNPTILSGDIGTVGVKTDNCYHVVLSIKDNDATILDGFTIQDGYAVNGSESGFSADGKLIKDVYGAGMVVRNSIPKIRNCIFKDNIAKYNAGGIYNDNFPIDGTMPVNISNCQFLNNNANASSSIGGGGMYNRDVSAIITNCEFKGNTTGLNMDGNSGAGAAMVNDGGTPIISNCLFYDNTSRVGGAVYNGFITNAVFTNCVFSQNDAVANGGGMFNDINSKVVLKNLVFDRNTAQSFGGGVLSQNGTDTVVNCTFYANTANSTGGFRHSGSIYPSLFSNCIFWDNEQMGSTSTFGAGLNISSTAPISNCLFQVWSHGTNSILGQAPGFVNSADPDGADNQWMTADDGLGLDFYAAALDSGNDAAILGLLTDLSGNNRNKNRQVDRGAYEYQASVNYKILDAANQTLPANLELPNGNYTDYYYADATSASRTWLLSIAKNGEDIGKVGDGTFDLSISNTTNHGTNTATDLSTADYVTATEWYAFNRYWNVIPTTQPSAVVNVKFPYSAQDFLDLQGSVASVSNHTDLVFFKTDNTNNPHALNITGSDYHEYTSGAVSSSTWAYVDNTSEIPNSHYAEFQVSSFSGGSAGAGTGTSGGALPVELISFQAKIQGTAVLLSWQTITEQNNLGFEVQRSSDAQNWESIAFETGRGNTTIVSDYNYLDRQPFEFNYYRLKQIDTDNQFKYSKVIYLRFETKEEIKLFPNPSSGEIRIDLSSLKSKENLTLYIINQLGQVQKRQRIKTDDAIFIYEVPHLRALHYVQVKDEQGKVLAYEKILFID